jgi:hypothetical protein
MTGILLDLAYQLGTLAFVVAATIGVLVIGELARDAIADWRAASSEWNAAERLRLQPALGVRERITGDVIAERRR